MTSLHLLYNLKSRGTVIYFYRMHAPGIIFSTQVDVQVEPITWHVEIQTGRTQEVHRRGLTVIFFSFEKTRNSTMIRKIVDISSPRVVEFCTIYDDNSCMYPSPVDTLDRSSARFCVTWTRDICYSFALHNGAADRCVYPGRILDK